MFDGRCYLTGEMEIELDDRGRIAAGGSDLQGLEVIETGIDFEIDMLSQTPLRLEPRIDEERLTP